MAKMADLYARGITNLQDYTEGRRDERGDIIAMLKKTLDNDNLYLLSSEVCLRVLIASLSWEEDLEQEQEHEGEH